MRSVSPGHATYAVFAAVALVACGSAPGSPVANSTAEPLGTNPQSLNIGFNGESNQFPYFKDFFDSPYAVTNPGPRVCHWYVPWNVAQQAAGSPTSTKSLAYLEGWLRAAEGQCSEALISFQAEAPAAPPSQADYKAAFEAFVGIDWKSKTTFSGTFSFTPWNEPNNGAGDGNGLGKPLPPDTAATYYLTAAHVCASHDCRVAAGDLASNGDMWDDFEWNCADDNVAPDKLCSTYSSENPGHSPASYLDQYKNYIVNHASDYSLGDTSYRPKYFAFHGWHDINEYLSAGSECTSYSNCATRRLLQSLGGSWSSVQIWDTEIGIGQFQAYSPAQMACGAAFLLNLASIDSRVTRMYYTRLYGGNEQLVSGGTPSLALDVLASRKASMAGACTSGASGHSATESYDAFQASTGALWTTSASGPSSTTLGMMAKTSPSISLLASGGFQVAFQANTGALYTEGAAGTSDTGLGMMGGTSPSITSLSSGVYQIAFQANTGALWTTGSEGTASTGLGMMAGTSPSIVGLPQGGYEVALQANTGHLWFAGSAGTFDTSLDMKAGTSPSITVLSNGDYQAAFEGSDGDLWYATKSGGFDAKLVMAADTSPSIAALPSGGFELAVQASDGHLWVAGNDGTSDTGLVMMPATSPSVAALSTGYEVLAQGSNGHLWSAGTGGNHDTGLDMMVGTSPSVR